MLRLLSVLVLVRLLAQSTGLDHAVGESCDTPCEESDEGGGCTPTCTDCLCCAHRPLLSLPLVREPVGAAPDQTEFLPVMLPAGSCDPREIMHVPRTGLFV